MSSGDYGRNLRFPDSGFRLAIPDHANLLDLAFDDIAWFQELWRRPSKADAAGRARSDDVSGQKGHPVGQLFNGFRHVEDHVRGAAALFDHAIDPALNA